VKRREYNTSKQAMDLLETIRAHYKVIDFNIDTGADAGSAGAKPDLEVVRRLYQSHRVKQDKADGMINLPQVIIDGVNIGDESALQALEDDGYLDEILKQTTCPQCLTSRSGEYCYNCKTLFQEMMPGRQTRDDLLSRLRFQRIAFVQPDSDDDEEDEEEIEEEQTGDDVVEGQRCDIEPAGTLPRDRIISDTRDPVLDVVTRTSDSVVDVGDSTVDIDNGLVAEDIKSRAAEDVIERGRHPDENDDPAEQLPLIDLAAFEDGEDIVKAIENLVLDPNHNPEELTAREDVTEPDLFHSARDKGSEINDDGDHEADHPDFASEATVDQAALDEQKTPNDQQ